MNVLWLFEIVFTFLTQVGLHLYDDLKIPFIKCMAARQVKERDVVDFIRSVKHMCTTCGFFFF